MWTGVPVEAIADGIERQMVWRERIMIGASASTRARRPPSTATRTSRSRSSSGGRVRFTVDGTERMASAGDVLHFPSGVSHGATILDEEVVLVDIFSPIREEFLKSG